MKKIIYAILGVMFLLPVMVKADAGPPEIKAYKIVPKEAGAITYYDYDFNVKGTITVTEIEVSYEVKHNGEVYAMGWNNGVDGYVKLSDFKAVNPTKAGAKEALYKAVVFEEEGLDVYAGPSYINEKVGTLAYGTEVSSALTEDSVWTYVESGDIKGYVNITFGSIGILTNAKRIDVATNTEYSEFYKLDAWSRDSVMVKDGSSYKKITTASAFQGGDKKALTTCNVYAKADTDDTVVGTLTKDTVVTPLYVYSYNGYISTYVTTGSTKGWVRDIYSTTYCLESSFAPEGTTTEKQEIKPVEENKEEYVKAVEEEKEPESKGFEFTPKMIIIISICLGIIVVLTAIVTLALVNKKDKINE